MKSVRFLSLALGLLLSSAFVLKAQVFEENFTGPAGDTLGNYGWVSHSGTNQPIFLKSGSLSYVGYPTNSGNSASVRSGQDYGKTFTAAPVSSGSLYCAMLVNMDTVKTTADYFFHTYRSGGSSSYFNRIYVKKAANNNVCFGVLKGTAVASIAWTDSIYALHTTYLLILKVNIASGADNDTVSLFVDPVINGVEPAVKITATDLSSNDYANIDKIAIRQGTQSSCPVLTLDGIRVATNWTDLFASTDAALSDLKVGGTTLPGFASAKFSYDVVLPYGTVAVPTVVGVSDVDATIEYVHATSLPGVDSVKVTAQDGTTRLLYLVDFKIAPPSTDASLSDLKVGGITVTGFSATTYVYDVTLPSGATVVPALIATTADGTATMEYVHATSLPGVDSVKVTAQDGTTTLLYLVDFAVAAATDASLSDLKVNGTTVAGFAPTTYAYTVTLPYGTTTVPSVAVAAIDGNATIAFVHAVALPGVDSVKVTAQDGVTELLYLVHFAIAPAATDASLSDLKVGGTTVVGLSPATYVYNVVLPVGATTVPAVTATATDTNASIVYVHAAALPGLDSVKVTAQDGTTKKLYLVHFSVAIQTYTVTYNVVGANGTLTATVDGNDVTSPATVQQGKSVVFTATPTANFMVKEWILDGAVVSGNISNSFTLSNVSADTTVTVEFTSSTGIDENNERLLNVYPNPANDRLNVKSNALIHKISVVSLNGQVVLETWINRNEGVVNTSKLSNGLYFLRIETASGVMMEKIQISK